MSKLDKYMVYNPQQSKPKVYYNTYEKAIKAAKEVSAKEIQDVLVLRVIAKIETTKTQVVYENENQ